MQTSRLVYYKAQTAYPLLPDPISKQAIIDYFRGFLSLACAHNTDYILDSVTWKAHMHWAGALGASEREPHEANKEAIARMVHLREEFASNVEPILLKGVIGPQAMPTLPTWPLPCMRPSTITRNRLVGSRKRTSIWSLR